MGYKPRKGSNGRSKLHAVRQHRSSKNHAGLSSCIHRRVGGEGLRRVRSYIMKALDFGVESGYLVPTNKSYRLLRVSSDLFAKQRRRKTKKTTKYIGKTCDSLRCSPEREKDDEPNDYEIGSTTRFEDYPVQDACKKRRKRRKRSRSQSRRRRRRSRKCSKRRRNEENPEEAGEDDDDDDDYELNDNTEKKNTRTRNTSNDARKTRQKTQDIDKTDVQGADDISDVSIDEDDTDEYEDKDKDNTTKS